MTAAGWIGNDVVDLDEPGAAGKERDARFMARAFTPAERARILDAPVPTVALWQTWAAKESAFKVARKMDDRVLFAHRGFEVTVEGPQDGVVCFENVLVRVCWEFGRGYIHCVGFAENPRMMSGTVSRHHYLVADIGDPLAGTLTAAERTSVHSAASERARLLAHQLVERWGVGVVEIVRPRQGEEWRAPMVAQDGRRLAGFDVSLSHDGRFVAAAMAGPPRR